MTNLSCLSGDRRTAPQSSGSRTELFSPPLRSRINGWSPPLHGFQLLAWLLYGFMAVVGFGVYVPLLPAPWSSAAYGTIGAVFLLHLLSHVAAVTVDPADLSVRSRKEYSSPVPVFDNTKHQHVIHNLHCSLCEVDVGPKAKHCSSCNKCIADFDHHCKWLNNCVGGRNYWFFFVTISSAVAGMVLLIPVVLFVFVEHYVNPSVLRTAPQFQTVKGNGTWLVFLPAAPLETSSLSLLVLAFITVLLGLAALLLLCHLLCFHVYLLSQGISTYEYIVRKRQSPNPKEKEKLPAPLPSNGATAQSLGPLESPVDCDAPLSSRSCAFKLEDKGQTPGRLPEPICAELEEVNGERREESPAQMIPGKAAALSDAVFSRGRSSPPLCFLLVGEPLMSLPVGRTLGGTSAEKPIVQDPLGSSIMDRQQGVKGHTP
ncbi:palmitoyltransferase ZDHHC11 isoform X2 [Puntigrus tetrazona]|uniref:palmitoyltransferase ZDHHC11 isoform X2 n=1 Tax=Puntigrus tetrazona TaxID=1606681 RepID=UPI001C89638A|nr:palmitoyltransferase ZDHHC11 isoform X2 [Puntigrus tetrazona]